MLFARRKSITSADITYIKLQLYENKHWAMHPIVVSHKNLKDSYGWGQALYKNILWRI